MWLKAFCKILTVTCFLSAVRPVIAIWPDKEYDFYNSSGQQGFHRTKKSGRNETVTLFDVLCRAKGYLAFFFSFHDGLGPNFLRGRPLSLDDLRLGWSSLWATEA